MDDEGQQKSDPDLLARYSFLRDASLSDDLKKFLVEKSLQNEAAAWTNKFELKKWRWSTPLVIALTGVITIGANFTVDYLKGTSDANRKAETAAREFQYRVVERELTQDKPEKDRARVLLFLVRSGVLGGLDAKELRQMAEDTLNDKTGPGVGVPSLGSLSQDIDARRTVCDIPFRLGTSMMAEISSDWLASNLIDIAVPQLKKLVPPDGKVRINKIAASALKEAFAEVEARGLMSRVLTWDGTFSPRLTGSSGVGRLSIHACGIAFDINARWNGFGALPAAAGTEGSVAELVPIFEKHGFEWAGRRSIRQREGMHFEFIVSAQH